MREVDRQDRAGTCGDRDLRVALHVARVAIATPLRATRPFGEGICPTRRLCVGPAFRGLGGGRRLAGEDIEAALREGYAKMHRDAVPGMVKSNTVERTRGAHRSRRAGVRG